MKNEHEDLSKLYKRLYRENFKTANLLGWLFTVITAIVVYNFLFIPYYTELLRLVMYALVIFLTLPLIVCWLYLFPAIAHYQLRINHYLLVFLKMGVVSIPAILMQLLLIGIYLGVVYYLPPLLILFGITPIAIVQTAIGYNMFQRMERNESVNK